MYNSRLLIHLGTMEEVKSGKWSRWGVASGMWACASRKTLPKDNTEALEPWPWWRILLHPKCFTLTPSQSLPEGASFSPLTWRRARRSIIVKRFLLLTPGPPRFMRDVRVILQCATTRRTVPLRPMPPALREFFMTWSINFLRCNLQQVIRRR